MKLRYRLDAEDAPVGPLLDGSYTECSGGIYIAQNKNAYKVGLSSDIPRRMVGLQVGCPGRLWWVGYKPGDRKEEKRIHKKLRRAGYSQRGEWFTIKNNARAVFEGLGFEVWQDPGISWTRQRCMECGGWAQGLDIWLTGCKHCEPRPWVTERAGGLLACSQNTVYSMQVIVQQEPSIMARAPDPHGMGEDLAQRFHIASIARRYWWRFDLAVVLRSWAGSPAWQSWDLIAPMVEHMAQHAGTWVRNIDEFACDSEQVALDAVDMLEEGIHASVDTSGGVYYVTVD